MIAGYWYLWNVCLIVDRLSGEWVSYRFIPLTLVGIGVIGVEECHRINSQ